MLVEKFAADNLGILNLLSAFSSTLSLVISTIAAYVAFKAFRRKTGAEVRGYFQVTSSIYSEQMYVSQIILENVKDRPVNIFAIYLWLSHNYRVTLETFDEDHVLTIPPYSLSRRSYDPIIGYSFNLTWIDLNRIMSWDNKKAYMYLDTSMGRLKVGKWWPLLNPAFEYLRNHNLVTVATNRLAFGGKSFGDQTKYVVQIFKDDNLFREFGIRAEEHQLKWFRNLGGSEESLLDERSLSKVFKNAIRSGKIDGDEVKVYNFQNAFLKTYDYDQETVVAEPKGWFKTNIIGLITTRVRNWLLRRANRLQSKALSANREKPTEEDVESSERSGTNS